MKKNRVLFVCLGNICRSPTAHGVFESLVKKKGYTDKIIVDSAGTSGWHIGKKPDSRTIKEAKKRGYNLQYIRSRKAVAEDFSNFDYILAMDKDNLFELKKLKPKNYKGKLELFLNYSPETVYREVPDPYYGGEKGFTLVLDLIEEASEKLLHTIVQER